MLASAGIRRYGSPSSFSTILLSYHRSHEPKFVACSINEFLQPDWRNNQRNKFSSFSSTHWSSNGLRNSRSLFYQNGVSVRSVAPPSRNFSATGDPSSPLSVALYQYSICPFCNRVKTVLDYIGSDALSVQHVEVNPLTKSEIQPWKKVYRKVPIATVNQETIFGSDEIIHSILAQPIVRISLDERWRKAAFSSPTTMTWDQFTSSSEWTEYATKELAVWLYPNMCRTWSDSYRAFDYIHEKPYSSLQRFLIQNVGSLAMYFAANKIKSTFCVIGFVCFENLSLPKLLSWIQKSTMFRMNSKRYRMCWRNWKRNWSD